MENAILPHINKLSREGRVKNYFLQFNNSNGENLRLPLLVSAGNALNVARETGDHFTSYFYTLPEIEDKKEDHAHKLFMDFPCNTIQYGLYSVDNGDPHLQQSLSEVIIEALCTEIKDDTIIIRLAFYLYVTLLQIASANTRLSFNQLLTMEYCLYIDVGETDEALIIKLFFEENRHMLFDTCYNVMKLREGLPAWVYQWAAVCETRFNNCLANNNSPEARKKVFNEIARHIDDQMNLNIHVKLLLFHFIRQITAV